MPRYQISITLEVETDNPGGWAFAAAEHLNESFNDDGTLLDPFLGVDFQLSKEDACSS